jgi:hypothetical protein
LVKAGRGDAGERVVDGAPPLDFGVKPMTTPTRPFAKEWRRTWGAAVLAGLLAISLSAPAFADGGPARKRGEFSDANPKNRVRVAPPAPPVKAAPVLPPAPAPAPTKKTAGPVTPPVTPPVVTPAAPPKTATVAPAPAPVVPLAPSAPEGARAGTITLDEGVVLTVPQGWAFWPAAEAQAYVRRSQTIAPGGQILGMIAPAELRPTDSGFWGSIVAFNRIGRVAEERADRFTAIDFLDEARGTRPTGAPRLIGFPVAPAYDPARKAITWGERYDTATAGASDRPLRLEHRLLGRRGTVGLTTPARADQLTQLTAFSPMLSDMLGFAPGSGFNDVTASDSPPLFDLPGVITNRPRGSSPATVASAGGPTIRGTPLNPGGSGPPPATIDAVATTTAAGAAGGALFGLDPGLFQWIAAGIVLLAAIPWIWFRKDEDDYDANLAPRR